MPKSKVDRTLIQKAKEIYGEENFEEIYKVFCELIPYLKDANDALHGLVDIDLQEFYENPLILPNSLVTDLRHALAEVEEERRETASIHIYRVTRDCLEDLWKGSELEGDWVGYYCIQKDDIDWYCIQRIGREIAPTILGKLQEVVPRVKHSKSQPLKLTRDDLAYHVLEAFAEKDYLRFRPRPDQFKFSRLVGRKWSNAGSKPGYDPLTLSH